MKEYYQSVTGVNQVEQERKKRNHIFELVHSEGDKQVSYKHTLIFINITYFFPMKQKM